MVDSYLFSLLRIETKRSICVSPREGLCLCASDSQLNPCCAQEVLLFFFPLGEPLGLVSWEDGSLSKDVLDSSYRHSARCLVPVGGFNMLSPRRIYEDWRILLICALPPKSRQRFIVIILSAASA